MSVLGHVTVRETRGIRRFLYPLSARIDLPESCQTDRLGLVTRDGQPIPVQVSQSDGRSRNSARIDFAVSLAPFESLELELLSDQSRAVFEDALNIAVGKTFRSAQRRFAIAFDNKGMVNEVLYDGIPHLADATVVTRNGEQMAIPGDSDFTSGLLAARVCARGRYADTCRAEASLEITACKSWAMMRHVLFEPRPLDEVMFRLQLAVASPVLTCDFGVGGGTYGKLLAGSAGEIVWRSDFSRRPAVGWSISTGGRTDYAGEVEASAEFRAQRWFHLIDKDKSLAVAITDVAKSCREMTVTLRSDGAALVKFRLGEPDSGPAVFGLCYHFLNDIPAIAAATNPQSILLPPIVEVFPRS